MDAMSLLDSVVTVQEVLELPLVVRGVPEVVAGEAQLGRPIRWVHSGEANHIGGMLKGGELILMTGIAIGETAGEQRRFISDVAAGGAAGLLIELGTRFRDVLPAALAREAERVELPLIVLHQEIRFVELTEAVHREIVGRQLTVLRRSHDVQRRFNALLLDGAGVPEVLHELAEVIGNPVVLAKGDGRVVFHASGPGDDASALAAWDAYLRRLPSAPDGFECAVPTARDEPWGRVTALAVRQPLEQMARAAVEGAVGSVALVLIRQREEELAVSRERGNFLGRLLEAGVDESEARQRAADFGFPRRPAALLAIAVQGEQIGVQDLRGLHVPMIAGVRDDPLLIVVALRDPGERQDVADLVASVVTEAAAQRRGRAMVSVGASARTWRAAGDALRTAVDALAVAARYDAERWYDATLPSLDALLATLRDRPQLSRFAEARLAPLLEHDTQRSAKLLPTLDAYCRYGGRKADAARALFVKRQTLYHRLGRIEALLHCDLADPATLFDLQLALRIHEDTMSNQAPKI
jgi:purine catabolism regulator